MAPRQCVILAGIALALALAGGTARAQTADQAWLRYADHTVRVLYRAMCARSEQAPSKHPQLRNSGVILAISRLGLSIPFQHVRRLRLGADDPRHC